MSNPMTYYVHMTPEPGSEADSQGHARQAYMSLKSFRQGFSSGEYVGKWPGYKNDIREFSKKHPEVIFAVTRNSDEEDGDDETYTYLNGEEKRKWPFKPQVGDTIFLVMKSNKTETSYSNVLKVGRVWFTVYGTASDTRFDVNSWKCSHSHGYSVYPDEAAYEATLVRPRVLDSLSRLLYSGTIPRPDLSHVSTESLLQIEKMLAKPQGT